MLFQPVRQVWRFQRGNRKPYVIEGQWAKDKTTSIDLQNTTYETIDCSTWAQLKPLWTQVIQKGKLSCFTNGTRHVTLAAGNKSWIRKGQGYYYDKRYTGADPGEGRTRRTPPKSGKNMIFWRKIMIFHTKYRKMFALPPLGAICFNAPPP